MHVRKIGSVAGLAALSVLAIAQPLTAWAGTTGIHQATLAEQGAKTSEVSTEQLRQILLDGSAILLDTRSAAEFDAGHIPGASILDVPAADQIAAVSKLVGGDKAKALILYCNGPFCQASRRLADQLASHGFTNVRRYQLGIPVWRALGGPVAIKLTGIKRILGVDRTAVFIDARPAADFATGRIAGSRSAPVDDVISGALKKIDLPEDDFNRRIVLFGRNGAEARKLADFMSKRPWHNVSFFLGTYAELVEALSAEN